jgi:H+/gluconate symporter-like permease
VEEGLPKVLEISGASQGPLAPARHFAHLLSLLYGWLNRSLIRVATGSATVSLTVRRPFYWYRSSRNIRRSTWSCMIISIGCGSLVSSHIMNDGRLLDRQRLPRLTVNQTLRTVDGDGDVHRPGRLGGDSPSEFTRLWQMFH